MKHNRYDAINFLDFDLQPNQPQSKYLEPRLLSYYPDFIYKIWATTETTT